LLLVEDDDALAEGFSMALTGLGHQVELAGSGEQALARGDQADLILLDVMLPGIDGFEVCRRIRATSMVPVIMMTARGDPVDVVVGLEGGADDYVVKPAEPRVVDARIKTVLRRASASVAPGRPRIRIGHLVIDPKAMTVTSDEQELHLTATEMRLLLEFAEHPGQVLTRQALLKRVWDYGYVGDSRLVDAAVARLRAKVEKDSTKPSLLRTVRGIGYRLVEP
jgi:DNA-binding response OmpR family regulator